MSCEEEAKKVDTAWMSPYPKCQQACAALRGRKLATSSPNGLSAYRKLIPMTMLALSGFLS